MVSILLMQLFWFSLPVVGWGTLLGLQHSRPKHSAGVQQFCAESHGLVSVFIYACVGVAVCVPVVLLGYVFELPIWTLTAFYLLCFGFSFVALCRRLHKLPHMLWQAMYGADRKRTLFGLAIFAIVLVEYIAALKAGVDFHDDTPVHVAKLQLQLNRGDFTFADPSLGYNGVLDLRYSINVLGTLQVVIASLLHITVYKVWFYSAAFHRLFLATALFALARVYLPKEVRSWSYLILTAAPIFSFLHPYFFEYSELPHAVVLIWTCLLFIGLKLLFERQSRALLWLAIILIAATHAIASAYSAVFLASVLILIALLRKLTRREAIALSLGIGVLLIPTLVNLLMPSSGAAPAAALTADKGLHEIPLITKQAGPFVIPRLILHTRDYYLATPIMDMRAIIIYIVLGAYAVLLKRLPRKIYKQIFIWVLFLGALEVFNIYYVSTLGYLFLIKRASSTKTRIVLIVATLFYVCIAYNPLVLTVVAGHIPLWFVARFQELNTFAFVAPMIGMLVAFRAVAQYWDIPQAAQGYSMLLAILLMVGLPYPHSYFQPGILTGPPAVDRKVYSQNYKKLNSYTAFDHYVKNQIVYTDDIDLQDYLAFTNVGPHFGVIFNPQSNQMQNLVLRTQCMDALLSGLRAPNLAASRATVVIVRDARHAERGTQFMQATADRAPYLKFEAQIGHDRVYKFSKPAGVKPSVACTIPYRQ